MPEVPSKPYPAPSTPDAGNEMFEGDPGTNSGPFKKMETWEGIEGHYDGSIGATEDPTTTKTTRMQLALGGMLSEKTTKMPDYNGQGLSNEKYHSAAGGGDIPMTYSG
jgi:hypothetical protein